MIGLIGSYIDVDGVGRRIHDGLHLDNYRNRVNLFAVITFAPALLFLVSMAIIPAIYIFWVSLHEVSILSLQFNWVGLQNYTDMLNSQMFWHSLWTGTVFSAGSTFVQLVLGLAIALLLNKDFTGSWFARTLAIVPYLIPTIVVALMWKFILSPSYGVVNGWLIEFGLLDNSISFFGSIEWAMPFLIMANSWKFTAFATIIFLARLQSIDQSMYEQARISGASTFQMFRHITLPNLRSAILLVVLLRSIWMFHKFDIVYLLTQGGPLDATTTVPIVIYHTTFSRFDLGMGATYSIVLFAVLSVAAVLYFWRFNPSQEVATQ